MIVLDIPQGTEAWHKARCGVVTASGVKNIITPTGKKSTSAAGYMNQLLADWFAGEPVDAWEGNKFTEIGHEREPESRALYEFLTDAIVEEVGFVYLDDDRLIGASPDGLVGDSGLVELKNPKASTVVGYALDGKVPNTYIPQIQCQLWVTGRDWCDFMAHHDHVDIGDVLLRVERNDKYIETMAQYVADFIGDMLDKREKLREIWT